MDGDDPMELHQVRYFLALAQTLNFTKAAESCGISQPALTKAVQRLEGEFGGALVRRERNLTQLTDLGREILPLLEQTHVAASAAKARAAEMKSSVPPLRLGLAPCVPEETAVLMAAAIAAKLPDVAIHQKTAASPALIQSLLHGTIDAALLLNTTETDGGGRLHRWSLYRDPLVVLCRPDHPFAASTEIAPAELRQAQCIGRTGEACPVEALLGSVGISVRHRAATDRQIRAMIHAGLGVAIVGSRAAGGGLVAVPIADPSWELVLMLAVVAGRPYSPALSLFVKLGRANAWAS